MTNQTLTPGEVARQLNDSDGCTLIDVRTSVEFAAVHIRGARNIPLDRLDPAALPFSRNSRGIYLICQSGSRAAKAYDTLRAAGYDQAAVVEGGINAWVRDGLPVERREILSLERQVRIGAGLLVLIGVALGIWVNPWLLAIAAFAGAGLVFAGVTNFCGLAMLLAKAPWNRFESADGRPIVSCEL